MRATIVPTHHGAIKKITEDCGNLLGLFHLDLCVVHTWQTKKLSPHRSVCHSIILAVIITSSKQSFAEMVADFIC